MLLRGPCCVPGSFCVSLNGTFVQIIDLKKELKHLYQPSAKEVVQIDVPTLRFLMIDGEGDPNTSSTTPKQSKHSSLCLTQ